MEEKKRKKAKKKKRSAPSENVADATAPPLYSTLSDIEGVPSPTAVATTTNVPSPALKEEEEVRPKEAPSTAQPAPNLCLREEFKQVVRELKSVFESETKTATAFRVFLEDLKTSHATSQANLELLIEQLRKEVVQLNQSTRLQKNREVDLDGDIQRLREEISQLRAIQEVQEERKQTAKHAEIRQLQEEIVKLSEGGLRQLRKVEEISDTIQLLLERGHTVAPMGSSQLGQNLAVCPSFASEVGVTLSSETSEQLVRFTPSQGIVAEAGAVAGNSHFLMATAATMVVEEQVAKIQALVEKVDEQCVSMENPTQQHCHVIQLQNDAVTSNFEAEQITCSDSLADHLMVEKNTEAQTREVSMVDALYSEGHEIETGSMDEHGRLVDNIAFVNSIADFKHTKQDETELHHEATPNMIFSDLPQHALMQANSDLKPFSDAPITGAPIRLFRSVARYVSGADLVKG